MEAIEKGLARDLPLSYSWAPESTAVIYFTSAFQSCGPDNVFVVGTGPWDPELLTLKVVRDIYSADLLLYYGLVSNDVLDLVRPEVRLLYVGKTAGYHSRTEEEIHELLPSFADVGATVVRFKGGDPPVFGRGGKEMDFLQQLGIESECFSRHQLLLQG